MGQCLEKIKCPDCDSTRSLQTFLDTEKGTYYGICFGQCGQEYKADPYQNGGDPPEVKIKTPEEIMEEVRAVQKCTKFQGLGGKPTYRGIDVRAFSSWGVRLLVSEFDGKTPYAIAFPYTNDGRLCGWKCRTIKKKDFFGLGTTRDVDMFGWERANKIGGKRLYITEGEFDAIALDYALVLTQRGTKYSKNKYPVVSLTSGGGSVAANLAKLRKRISKRFDEIVLVFDNDEVGQEAEKEAQKLWPDVLRADKPGNCKDANEAVEKGLTKELGTMVLFEAHKPPLQGVIRVSDVLARALEPPVFGLSYPFEALTEMTFGQRYGEAVCLGAGVGTGKTVTAHRFAAHNMTVHKQPCFLVLLEEQNHYTVKNIAANIDSIPYSNPRCQYDPERLIATAESLQSKLFMWESEGDQHLRFDMDEIISAIRFNALEYGCKFAYIDNFTRLVDHLDASAANEFINKYSSEIENLAAQLDIHIMTYSHLNAAKWGPSHEEGAEVFASQFTGSRGIMRSFPMLMSFRRNKHANPDEGKDKNNSIIGVIKNRKYGNEGEIRTIYQPNTGQLVEYDWEGDLMNEEKGKR